MSSAVTKLEMARSPWTGSRPPEALLIAAKLTTPSFSGLGLSGDGLTVAGTIFGDINVNANGSFTGTNTYTGRTNLTLDSLALTNAGGSAASSRWDLRAGTLTLAYGPASEVDKIGDAAPIDMYRSELLIQNASGTPVNETIGTITISKSANTIRLTTTDSASGALNVSLPTILRSDFASALIDVNPSQGTRLTPTAAPSAAGVQPVIHGWLMGVVKPASDSVDGPLSFITSSGGNGLPPLDLVTEYVNTIDGSQSDTRLTTTQTISNSSASALTVALRRQRWRATGQCATEHQRRRACALGERVEASAEILSFSGTGMVSTPASEMNVWTDGARQQHASLSRRCPDANAATHQERPGAH